MMEPAHAGTSAPRAFLRMGGATIARHQLALALSAGCERIVCHARQLEHDLIELQHVAERAGAKFHMISGARALSGLVTAQDDVLVLADGLVPSPRDALELMAHGPAIFNLPADTAVLAGFERIDVNHASAGLMLIPGRLIERLNELPDDTEPGSALLRIGLQSGVKQRLVPQNVFNSGGWVLIRNEDEAHGAEQRWMDRHSSGEGGSPGQALAAWNVRRFGPALLHAGSGARAFGVSGIAPLLLSLAAAWFGFAGIALVLLVPAWLMQQSARIIDAIQQDALGGTPCFWARSDLFGGLLDVVLVADLFLVLPPLSGEHVWDRLFVPVMLVGLLRLAGQLIAGGWRAWLVDRAIAALVLSACAATAVLPLAVQLLAVSLLIGCISASALGLTRA